MRLLRVGENGAEVPAVLDESGAAFSLASITSDIDGAFFERGGVREAREALLSGRLEPLSLESARIGAPVARPMAVICIGMNYAAHAAESGGVPPESPVVFFKHPNTVVGPYDDVVLPRGSAATDWEVELAVIIGRRCRYTSSPDDALAHVAGYAVANDVSERDFQLRHSGGQWSKGKCAETFNPLGPWLVPAEDVPDVGALRLRSWVNGDPRQDSSTADMVFSVGEILHNLSQYMVLEPGDVVDTGTPEGVALSGRFPYLQPGDVMELEIEGLGRQRQSLVSSTTSASSG